MEMKGHTDRQSWIQRKMSKKSHGQMTLVLRLSCKQKVKNTYTFFQFFGLNMVWEYIFGLGYNPSEVQKLY